MKVNSDQYIEKSLAQSLAVKMQINVAGTAGRLLKQIRDLEQLAPYFVNANLVIDVKKPFPLTIRTCGIATTYRTLEISGGMLYVCAATRLDVNVDKNFINTGIQDSICDIDDINYEYHINQLQVNRIHQAYKLADAALGSPERHDLILMDCPLVIDSALAPSSILSITSSYEEAYQSTTDTINLFWRKHRDSLYPWNPKGVVIAGIVPDKYETFLHVIQDLQTINGRGCLSEFEKMNIKEFKFLSTFENVISYISDSRLVNCLLNEYTRTTSFQLNLIKPDLDPIEVSKQGVIGLFCRSMSHVQPIQLQFIGDTKLWTRKKINQIVGSIMVLTQLSEPIPIQLASGEHQALQPFLERFSDYVRDEIKQGNIENIWLTGRSNISEENNLM